MATNKPRFSLTFDEAILKRVDKFQAENGYNTRSQAITALIRAGLNETQDYKAEMLENLRRKPTTRVMLEVPRNITKEDLEQVEAFARFLRRDDNAD